MIVLTVPLRECFNPRGKKQPHNVQRVGRAVRGNDHRLWCPPDMGVNPKPLPYQLFDLPKSLNVTEPRLENDNRNAYFIVFYF